MLTQNYWTNKVDYKINGYEILKDYDLIKIEIPKNKNKSEPEYTKIWNLLKKSIDVLAMVTYKRNFFVELFSPSLTRKFSDYSEIPILALQSDSIIE